MKLVNQSKNPHAFKDVSDNETTIAMVIWLLSFFTTFLGPLIIWVLKRDDSAFIDQQGKNYLNYLISYLIYTIIASVLVFVYRRRLIVHPWYSNDHLFNRRNHICTQRRRLRCAFYDRVY